MISADNMNSARDTKMFEEISYSPEVFAKLISSDEVFKRAAELIASRSITNVQVLARGTSDNAAHYLKYLIEVNLGLPVGLTSPSAVTIYGSKLNFSQTLLIAISQSGESPDLINYSHAAKEGKALVIAFTNNANSPLAKAADLHIDLLAGKEIAVAATKSYSAQLLSSYLLVMHWCGRPLANLESFLSSARALAENFGQVQQLAEELSYQREIVVLGRGYAYANAKELALKIQETSHRVVQGMSSADYLHGPIASLNNETQVIVISPVGLPPQSISEGIARIRSSSSRIIWVGNGNLAESGDLVFPGAKDIDEAGATILDAIVLQQIALSFSTQNGFNPDAPTGLTKVTKTL
jgi:glucosamine--fructose-6-phosphate aminotransferase (isomerizing)